MACWLSSAVHAQRFARVETQGRFNRIQVIIAVADLNGDGRDDIIAGGQPNDGSETVEDRLDKPPVQVFLGTRDGRLRLAPAEMLPSIRARTPVAGTDNFNGDGRLDFAVFDAGVYVIGAEQPVRQPAAPRWLGSVRRCPKRRRP
ncbi:MAG: VCBS repeat-containing protein [Acidobacteria bacterium]|nr:VCBS repeat-containing protein [Acidobacteriota bacterium]